MTEEAVAKDPAVSPEDMTDENLSEVLHYAMSKLLRKTSTDTVCSVRVFYKVGRSPTPSRIENTLARLEGFSIVYSIVPVCQLHNSHTFLSVCGVRHD